MTLIFSTNLYVLKPLESEKTTFTKVSVLYGFDYFFIRVIFFHLFNKKVQTSTTKYHYLLYATFLVKFWANYGLILGGNADFLALICFSKNQILGGGADCPIS